ncbi:MAG TPA: hypothetical protein VG992_03790 [Candidatus Saccharimonadales bacterium]|nr:hypothetical protein [Candidatus Saccharimonadales bacterium]
MSRFEWLTHPTRNGEVPEQRIRHSGSVTPMVVTSEMSDGRTLAAQIDGRGQIVAKWILGEAIITEVPEQSMADFDVFDAMLTEEN